MSGARVEGGAEGGGGGGEGEAARRPRGRASRAGTLAPPADSVLWRPRAPRRPSRPLPPAATLVQRARTHSVARAWSSVAATKAAGAAFQHSRDAGCSSSASARFATASHPPPPAAASRQSYRVPATHAESEPAPMGERRCTAATSSRESGSAASDASVARAAAAASGDASSLGCALEC